MTDWPEGRFTADQAQGFVVVVAFMVSTGKLAVDGPQSLKAMSLAKRERVDNERTMLASAFYGHLHQQGRLGDVAGQGLLELEWLCEHSNRPFVVAEATLAQVVMDACCRVRDWSGAERVAQLLPRIEHRPLVRTVEWQAAVDVLMAQCRFLQALALGQPERAGHFLEVEEQRVKHLGAIAVGPSLRAGVVLDRVALSNATEDFKRAIASAEAGLKQLETEALPAVTMQAHADRLRTALGTALVMEGQLAQADKVLAGVTGLGAVLQRAWIARAQGRHADFLALAEVPDAQLAGCEDAILCAGGGGLQLQVALASSPKDDAGRAARRARLEQIQGRMQPVFDALLASVARLPGRLGGVGFFHFEWAQQQLADLVAVQLALQPGPKGEQLAMELVLRAQSQGSLMRALAARPGAPKAGTNLAAVQLALPPDAVALVYLPSRYGTSLFAVARDQLVHAQLPARTEFDELAWLATGRLLTLAGEKPDALLKDLEKLRTLLLPKEVLASIDRYHHWIMVPGGTIANLPFEALPLDNGLLVGEAHAVSNLASLPLRGLLQDPVKPPLPLRMLLVANLAPPPHAVPAPQKIEPAKVGPWLERLLEPFPQAQRLADDDGTEAGLREQLPREHDILHILAHGVRDPEREFGWGLVLGGKADGGPTTDGALWPDDVLQFRTRGLVILSACRIGRAPRRLGEDHAGNLGGAFLHIGASAIVQSRAAIRLDETCRLMQEFHARLAKGCAWAEALRAARDAVRAQGLASRLHAAQMQLSGWSR